MDTEQKEAMDSWPEFPRAEQFMLLENGNRVYRAIITEEQYNQARDAIAAMQWRPIETAPKDGSSFLGAATLSDDKTWHIGIVRWKHNCFSEYGTVATGFTHWMPLPLPPQPTGEL